MRRIYKGGALAFLLALTIFLLACQAPASEPGDQDFIPNNESTPKEPAAASDGELSEELEREICDAFAHYVQQLGHFPNFPEQGEDYLITAYYGNFSGCEVLYVDYRDRLHLGVDVEYRTKIGPHEFLINGNALPIVYQAGAIYPLDVAYRLSLLSEQDIYDIWCLISAQTTERDEVS